MASFYDEINKNRRNSFLLGVLAFSFLVVFIYVMGEIFAPESSIFILIFSTIFVFLYTYGSYMYGDKVVLSATGARSVNENDPKYVTLVNAVDNMAIASGIPKPKIYVMESEEMNAFATGRDPKHSSVAVTTGLLKRMNRNELEGVIGHEMSHIQNYDIRFATLVAVLVGLIAIMSNALLRSWRFRSGDREDRNLGIFILIGFILAIFAPIVTRIVQAAISRRREFLADASSAKLTRYPEGLASALEKIKKYNEGKMNVSEAVSHLFFTDPNRSALDSLFATHPPIDERIKILRKM
jgi:heat shock protein HtpX